ncbi:hypothetical protein GCM10020331_037740 [Ectobacillus funiculus]
MPVGQSISASSNQSIQYRTHVQDIGWTNPVSEGEVSGTTGLARRMEAIAIDSSLPIEYQVHVQNKGWLPWVKKWGGSRHDWTSLTNGSNQKFKLKTHLLI